MDQSTILAALMNRLDDEGGRLSIVSFPRGEVPAGQERWMLGAEWGEEEPGSAMYAGAAYGLADDLDAALLALARDMGLEPPPLSGMPHFHDAAGGRVGVFDTKMTLLKGDNAPTCYCTDEHPDNRPTNSR